jgi:hypothetical protein
MDANKSSWNKSTQVLALVVVGILAFLIGNSGNNDEPQDVAIPDASGAPVFRYLESDSVTVEVDEFGQAEPYLNGDNWMAGRGDLNTQTIVVELELDVAIEYKALMQQGDSLSYSWKTDGGEVYTDFHAHDDAFGPDFFTRYTETEGTSHSGSIIAGYTGQHGWYWLNLSDGPLTITLEVSGFYDEIVEIDLYGE